MLKWKRPAAILMTAAMIITMPGVPVFAEEAGMSGGHEYTEVGYESAEKYGCGHDERRYTDSNCDVLENTAIASDSKKVRTEDTQAASGAGSIAILQEYSFATEETSIEDAEIVVRGASGGGKFVVRPELNSAKADIVEIYFDVKIGDKVLKYNQDYEVLNESYHGTDAGEYTLRIQGKGNLAASRNIPGRSVYIHWDCRMRAVQKKCTTEQRQ